MNFTNGSFNKSQHVATRPLLQEKTGKALLLAWAEGSQIT